MIKKVNNYLAIFLGFLAVILTELIMFMELNSLTLLICCIFVDILLVFIYFIFPRMGGKVSSIKNLIDAIKTRIFFFNSCLFFSKILLYENKITIFWVYTI
jgi:hypothetical protein